MSTTGFIACLCLFLALTPTCVESGVALGGACDNTTKTCDTTTDPLLICDLKASSPVCKLDAGGNCTDGAGNCATGLACEANVCANTSSVSPGGGTVATAALRDVGQSCNSSDKCKAVLQCNINVCTVLQGSPGGACTSNSNCTDPNSECVTTVCKCKSGFQVNTADYTCKSGSTTVMASIVLILLALLTSRLV